MSVKYNIVTFQGQPIELEGPWHMTAGIAADANHATCSFAIYGALTIGQAGTLEFFYNNSSGTPDVTIANITLFDAEPVVYGRDGSTGIFQAIKYRLILIDSRYAFAEPRGGRLAVGLVNPSTQIPTDADRSNIPASRTMTECIQACLNAMGIGSVTIPSISVPAPMDLKWLGSHAPSELEKLLGAADLIFCLQCDGSYTINQRNVGSDPTIPSGRALPATTLTGADARGDNVIFASYPTQVINTIATADITPATDLTIVYKNSSGAWEHIDGCGAYGSNTSSGAAIAEMNAHFPHTSDPAAQSACYRFMRLNPDKFDPINSPIQRKTYPVGGPSMSNPNGLPDEIDIQVYANIAVQDPDTKLWTNATDVNVPVDRVVDGNILSFSHRLVKLNLSGGATTTPDLEANCVAINLASDINIRLSVGSAQWNATDSLFEPEFFLVGYNGSAGSPNLMTATQTLAKMGQPDTLVIPIAELVGMRYGLNTSTAVCNVSQLQAQCLALAPRYLKDAGNPARQLEAVGFLPFTFDGTLSEVTIDQKAVKTIFKMCNTFRPAGHAVKKEFDRIRRPKESHPHQAKTAGARTARGDAGSSQPVAAMVPYVPPSAATPPFSTFAVNLNQSGGTNGTQTTTPTYTYNLISKVDGTQIGSSALSLEWNRPNGAVTAATIGLAYYDLSATAHLLQANEIPGTGTC